MKHRSVCICTTLAAYLSQCDIINGSRLAQAKLAAACYGMLTMVVKSVVLTGVAVLLFNVFGNKQ